MLVLTELLKILVDLVVALVHAATGRARRRYEASIVIRAPREIVWSVLRARDITFDGTMPMRVVREPLDAERGIERSRVTVGNAHMVATLRVIEERPETAIQLEILPQGTTPELVVGEDDYTTIVLHDHRAGTQLYIVRELKPLIWLAAVLVPLGLRSGVRRYKAKAERLAAECGRDA
jgi:hypothetical protein